jgi:hypothetical protein
MKPDFEPKKFLDKFSFSYYRQKILPQKLYR